MLNIPLRVSVAFLIVLFAWAVCPAQTEIPEEFNWCDSSIMTPVKNQSKCGACGEFAAVAVFEALIKMKTGAEVDLSEQQAMACVPGCGCGTGCSSQSVLEYFADMGALLEADFPFLNEDSDCPDELTVRYRLNEALSTIIDRKSLEERKRIIKETVLKYGPVATNMSFYSDLDAYRKGVYRYDGKAECLGGHWVVIVGWAERPGDPCGGYWICRNSWGEKWGEQGYFKSAYGDATGIDDFYIVYGEYEAEGDGGR